MEEQHELTLTQEQLNKIADYANSVIGGEKAGSKTSALAQALLAVTCCLHRLQASDPLLYGNDVNIWYDKEIGQNMRMNWPKVKPVVETLQGLGIL